MMSRLSVCYLAIPMFALCLLAIPSGAHAEIEFAAMDEATFLKSLNSSSISSADIECDIVDPAVSEKVAVLSDEQREIQTNCSATANCHNGTTVSCSSGGSCTAVDSNCNNNQRGYVTCGGTTTYCPTCPSNPPNCSVDGWCNPACAPYEDFDCECAIGAWCTNSNQCGFAGFCDNNRCNCY